MNVAARVEYDGTRFKGFQRQSPEKGPTVQGELEAAILRIGGVPVTLEAAGRTDSGVHASGQVIHFTTYARLGIDEWPRALNAVLPPDIAIRAACAAPEEFRARRCAVSRRYRYRLLCDARRSPLRERFAWRVGRALDVNAMDAAARLLLGEHDFGAFGSSPQDRREDGFRGHTVRTVTEARCVRRPAEEADTPEDGIVECVFAANAFLTGMVRRLVGTLALVGEGRLSVDDFRVILDTRAKAHPGAAAPPQGLCLIGVEYPAGLLSW